MLSFRRRLLALWRVLTNKDFILFTGLRFEGTKTHIDILNRTNYTSHEDYEFVDLAYEWYVENKKGKYE